MTILLVDLSGQPHIMLAVLRALHHAPEAIVHVAAEHRLQPVRFSRHAASYTALSSSAGEENLLDRIIALITHRRVEVALPSGVTATRFLSKYRQEIEKFCALTPLPPLETLELARNKGQLAVHMQEHAIPHPRTIIVSEPDATLAFFNTLGGPALAKPLLSAGGRGIRRIETPDELAQLVRAGRTTSEYLLQEFIPGYDIDCSFLSRDGTILAQTVQRGELPGSTRYAAPAGVEYLSHRGALESASSLGASLGWSGVAHLDMRYDERDGQVKVIELNPRFWRSLLGSVAVGVNFPYLACLHALGRAPAVPVPGAGRYVHETRIAIRQMLRQHGAQRPYRFRDTVLAESVGDPLPELALLLFHNRLPQALEG